MMFCSTELDQKFRMAPFLKNDAFRLQYSNYDTRNAISTPEYMLIYSSNMEMNMKLLIINSGEEAD